MKRRPHHTLRVALHRYWKERSSAMKVIDGILVALVAFALVRLAYVPAVELYEDISFALAPSGQKAFAYGERHFDAQDPSEYDVARALHYFQDALRLAPSLPYVHHELARIYFIRGDFADAMTQIDVQIAQEGDATPNSYYVRGLIEGYIGDYADSATDYAHFLQFDPHDWAALNDYSWVLLKAGRAKDAEVATSEGLQYFPDNAWLLNTNSIALYDIGDLTDALARAQEAAAAAQTLTQADWLHAYPGNDPSIAAEGLSSLRSAIDENMHSVQLALASSTVQSKASP